MPRAQPDCAPPDRTWAVICRGAVLLRPSAFPPNPWAQQDCAPTGRTSTVRMQACGGSGAGQNRWQHAYAFTSHQRAPCASLVPAGHDLFCDVLHPGPAAGVEQPSRRRRAPHSGDELRFLPRFLDGRLYRDARPRALALYPGVTSVAWPNDRPLESPITRCFGGSRTRLAARFLRAFPAGCGVAGGVRTVRVLESVPGRFVADDGQVATLVCAASRGSGIHRATQSRWHAAPRMDRRPNPGGIGDRRIDSQPHETGRARRGAVLLRPSAFPAQSEGATRLRPYTISSAVPPHRAIPRPT